MKQHYNIYLDHNCPHGNKSLFFLQKRETVRGDVEEYFCGECLQVFTFVDFDFAPDGGKIC